MIRTFTCSTVLCAIVALSPVTALAQTDNWSLSDAFPVGDRVNGMRGNSLTNWQPDAASLNSPEYAASFDSSATDGAFAAPQVVPDPGGPASTGRPWWLVAPYVWIPGMHGQVTSFGQTRPIDIDTSDALDQLHNANGALQLHLESGVGPVGLIVDTNIVRLSATAPTAGGTIDFDMQQTLLEVLGMYRIVDVPSDGLPQQMYSVDLLAGGRYYNFFNGITIDPIDPAQPTIPLGQSGTWVDLVIGVRGRAPLLSGLDAFIRTDFGGFGMGTSSTLAWNLIAGLDWHATEHCSFAAGYRVFDIDERHGTGASKFAFDAKMQGPFIALATRY